MIRMESNFDFMPVNDLATNEVVAGLVASKKIIDLSALLFQEAKEGTR